MKTITDAEFSATATFMKVDLAALKAVAEVESRGGGFYKDGRVKILFEPHKFWANLKKAGISPESHVNGNADILYKSWKAGAYGPESAQWPRLLRAAAIHKEAAYKSASWGLFQIMGENHKACGYESAVGMAEAFAKGEGEHLTAVGKFIMADQGLITPLRKCAWQAFAKRYNGPGYAKNQYDIKLQSAYNRFSKA